MRKIINQKAFTLIELLVVISIIGVLSGIVLVSMQGVRGKARDARRLSDMNSIIKGIQLYYDKFGTLPAISPNAACSTAGWDQGPCGTDPFIDALRSNGIMGEVPSDPVGKPSGVNDPTPYGYEYAVFPAGSNGCDPLRGNYFVLGVVDMESSNGRYPTSPGFSCPGFDFQTSFDWVVGGYVKDM